MQRQERRAEAGRERRGRLGDAAFGTGQFGGEARQEVIFGLFRREDRNRRQHAERVGRQEDHLLGGSAFRNRFDDVLDVVDRVRHAGVFGHRLVGEVDRAVLAHRHVFEQRIAFDGVPDVGFALLVEVDDFGIAAAFEIEDAFVVPSVLVVADEQTFRIGRERRLTGTRQTEEDGGVLAFEVGVGRAVHRSHALERQQVVHVGEHALLHFAAIPRIDDDLHFFGQVEHDGRFGIQAQLLVVFDLGFRGVQHDEVGLAVGGQFLGRGADEHVGHEMSLPSHLHDETDLEPAVFVGAAERVHDEEAFARKLLVGDALEHLPALLRNGFVIVLVFVRSPPDRVARHVVHHEELVFGRTARIDAGHDVHGSHVGLLTLFEAFETRFGFFFEQPFVRGIVYDLGHARDAVLTQIDL